MITHKNARLTPNGRALLVRRVVDEGLRPEEVAQAKGISVQRTYKWLRRYREEGEVGWQNRSSCPRRCPHEVSDEPREQLIERRWLCQTYRHIAKTLAIGHRHRGPSAQAGRTELFSRP